MAPSPGLDSIEVQLRDGVSIQAPGIGEIKADASSPDGDVNVMSHAHGDHLFDAAGDAELVCSPLTATLAGERRDQPDLTASTHPRIDLLPSGHIAGSRAAYIESDAGSILYTGDISTRDRYYLTGFATVEADVLIIESTYGEPAYKFPPVETVEESIFSWLDAERDSPAVLFGYTLGKAQKIQRIVAKTDRERVFTTDAVIRMNQIIGDALDVGFPAEKFDSDQGLEPGDILILPSGMGRFEWVQSLVGDADAVTAGFSGWAHDDSYIYRREVDIGFEVSDHCDFEELLAVVEAVNPEKVYTHHGSASVLARELTRRGYNAQALQENQTSLADFNG